MADTGSGIGHSVPRKEDDRYLRGRGEFIADIRLAGMRTSPSCAARWRMRASARIHVPDNAVGRVFTAADLTACRSVAVSALPGFKNLRPAGAGAGQGAPCRRTDRGLRRRHPRRGRRPRRRRRGRLRRTAGGRRHARSARPGAPLVHEHWGDNVFLETVVEDDLAAIRASAPIVVRRSLRTARQCMSPLEGRGVVAAWDRRLEQLLVYSSTQLPHIVRTGLAECLGLDQGRCASSRPMSAAASATRASCCRGSGGRLAHAASAIRCAGSRIGASS
jgi:carbon-monoxide dehydrogenase large subunit